MLFLMKLDIALRITHSSASGKLRRLTEEGAYFHCFTFYGFFHVAYIIAVVLNWGVATPL